jgi:CRISPR-associated protein (TIGR02710 family)
MLEDLCRTGPRDPYLRVEDLLLNAERRAAQGRYDDAIARIYRALELIAQIRLRTKFEIDTANVDPLKVPEPKRAALERHRSETGNIQLPLFAAWSLLAAMNNEPLGAWFAKSRSCVQDFLGTRNFSILAHGDRPIDQQTYQSVGSRGLALCREALASIPERKKLDARQLPDTLKFLDED